MIYAKDHEKDSNYVSVNTLITPQKRKNDSNLNISQPHEPLEIEADKISDAVINRSVSDPRHGQMEKSIIGDKTPNGVEISSDTTQQISNLSGGNPLSDKERKYFEPRLGADFGDVRIHNDSKAAETAEAINAKAYTREKDIVFAKGEYNFDSNEGKRLLAHELVHVQQRDRSDLKGIHRKENPNIFERAWNKITKTFTDFVDWATHNTILKALGDFFTGFGVSIGYNNLRSIELLSQMINPLVYKNGRVTVRDSVIDQIEREVSSNYDNNIAYQVGRLVGDIAGIVQGYLEIQAGGGMTAAGIAGAPESAALSLTVSAAGVAVMVHGGTVAGVSSADLVGRLIKIGALAMAAMNGHGGGEKKEENKYPKDPAERLKKMQEEPPEHADYKPPKNWNGNKVKSPRGSGWPDNKGRVWVPTNHKGTHAPHWDVQYPNGTYNDIYP